METMIGKHWHHLEVAEAAQILETDLSKGLDDYQVTHRKEAFGPNRITPPRGKSPLVRFLLQFNNPLLLILVVSGVVTAVVKQELVDALIIWGAVLVNGIIGYVQEARAEKAIEALHQSMTTEATVVRSGRQQRIDAAGLVPGDVVLLKSGDRVPADLRLFNVKDLQVAEAALTGESAPVIKAGVGTLAPDTVLADRQNMAYTSTLVTYGQGMGIVTATGDETEIGQISHLIQSSRSLETPLTQRMKRFSMTLLYGIMALAVVVFAVGVLRGQPAVDTFTATVALVVAIIPEGLPAALTVTLAIGVARMAKRRAVIRKLPAVETLGSVTVICSDKTGTLTQNQMTVQEIWAGGQSYPVSGSGYEPVGEVAGLEPAGQPALRGVLVAGLLCNDGSLHFEDEKWTPQGDPTEIALLVSARKAGMAAEEALKVYPRLDEIPFESQHQYMATLHRVEGESRGVMFMKGAAEAVLERSSQMLGAGGEIAALDPALIHEQIDRMAAQGMRVLAFARLDVPADTAQVTHATVAGGLTFLGLQGMIDPPREEATRAVQVTQGAGIRVKMITGDHALTAAAIARQMGILPPKSSGREVLTGKDLAALPEDQWKDAALNTHVFARVTPEQKLRLVETLQGAGAVVAMTGDGVNDGPALKQADIGIAMGISGTEVAKEAADMVLTDDNFATIEAAVEEGRGVFDNLYKIIAWTLPTNLGQGLAILAAVLLGVVMPVLPAQILWINLVTVVVLGLVLAMEPKEPGIMRRAPRSPKAPLFSPLLIYRTVLVALLIVITAFWQFEVELMSGSAVQVARTVAVNMIVVLEIAYLINSRFIHTSVTFKNLFSNRWLIGGLLGMIALQLLFTYAPFMNVGFHTAPVSAVSWLRITLIGLGAFVLIELEKRLVRWWQAREKNAKGITSAAR